MYFVLLSPNWIPPSPTANSCLHIVFSIAFLESFCQDLRDLGSAKLELGTPCPILFCTQVERGTEFGNTI